jgi:hypothetical protein
VALAAAAVTFAALFALGPRGALGGALAPESLGIAAVAASAPVAPAVALAVAEWLSGGLAPGRSRLRLLGPEEALQPSEEPSAGGGRCRNMLGGTVMIAPRALVGLRPLIARVAGLARLAGIPRLARIARVARLAGFAGIAGLPVEGVAPGLAPVGAGLACLGLGAAVHVLPAVRTERGSLVGA